MLEQHLGSHWSCTACTGILGVRVSQPPPALPGTAAPELGKVLEGGDRDKGGGSARVCVPGAPTGMR